MLQAQHPLFPVKSAFSGQFLLGPRHNNRGGRFLLSIQLNISGLFGIGRRRRLLGRSGRVEGRNRTKNPTRRAVHGAFRLARTSTGDDRAHAVRADHFIIITGIMHVGNAVIIQTDHSRTARAATAAQYVDKG